MKTTVKKTAVATGSILVIAGMAAVGASGIVTSDVMASGVDVAGSVEYSDCDPSERVRPQRVEGTFSYVQDEVESTEYLARNVSGASKTLCGAQGSPDGSVADANDWVIRVDGTVGNPFSATLGELAQNGSAKLVMGCSCAGNPADGRASANAEVLGVNLSYIMELAQVDRDTNTVVFTSADGYEVALPIMYVAQHFSLLAYDVNGEPVANSMGGTNQLWLGSTAASYFARDVESITFERRQTPPPRPGSAESGDVQTNTPNISVLSSETVGV